MFTLMILAATLGGTPQEDAAAAVAIALAKCRADAPTARDPWREVVVSVDAAGWHAEYKGRSATFPRATPAADVERLAGDWGREIDTPPPPPPTAFTPFRFTSGGT